MGHTAAARGERERKPDRGQPGGDYIARRVGWRPETGTHPPSCWSGLPLAAQHNPNLWSLLFCGFIFSFPFFVWTTRSHVPPLPSFPASQLSCSIWLQESNPYTLQYLAHKVPYIAFSTEKKQVTFQQGTNYIKNIEMHVIKKQLRKPNVSCERSIHFSLGLCLVGFHLKICKFGFSLKKQLQKIGKAG